MPQKQKLNGRKLNKQGLKYQYMKQKKYFVYILYSKRFEYKIYTENQQYMHIHVCLFKQEHLFM